MNVLTRKGTSMRVTSMMSKCTVSDYLDAVGQDDNLQVSCSK